MQGKSVPRVSFQTTIKEAVQTLKIEKQNGKYEPFIAISMPKIYG